MTLFWILATLLMLVAFALLWPALSGRRHVQEVDHDAQNVAIARDRLKELDAEFERGVIGQTEYEQARTELEQALLQDVEPVPTGSLAAVPASSRRTLLVVLIVVPLLAIGLYLELGDPGAIDNPLAGTASHANQGSAADKTASFQRMVKKLAARLKEKPDNAEGWFMLGRSYMTLGRYAEAAQAFAQARRLVGDDPDLLLRYADALAMAQGGKLQGQPFEMIQKALAAKPDDPTALWLAGLGYEEAGKYEKAIQLWRQLEAQLDDPASLEEVRKLIARAEQELGHPVKAEAPPAGKSVAATSKAAIRVRVSLAPELASQVKPDDSVFVFARALEGPSMPLAAARKQVRDLPFEITLDDSMAMMPQLKLSGFKQVIIAARISRSGQTSPQSGDLQGEVMPVPTDKLDTVTVRIDHLIP
ncbi:MAG: c-type cytochrome biogenesis protein CcmI [Alphaproteobacteria bacterium]